MPTDKKKILFVYSHTGSGHIVSAQAIEQSIRLQYPYKCEFEYLDFVGESSKFWSIFEYGYTPMIKYAPYTWAFLYKVLTPSFNLMLLEKSAEPFISRKLKDRIDSIDPDIIVSVHPLANQLITGILRKRLKKIPFAVVVTDPVTFHKSWLCCDRFSNIGDQTTAAVVATEEAKVLAVKYGFPSDKLHRIGLPVRSEFYEEVLNVRSDDRMNVLFMGGGDGTGKILNIIKELCIRGYSGKVTMLCGKNKKLKTRLDEMSKGWPAAEVEAVGFTNDVKSYMDAAHLLVTKAGPGTIAEAVLRELPMIIYYWIPGQEVGNAEFVKQKGIGEVIKNTSLIVDRIFQLQRNPEHLNAFKKNIRQLQDYSATTEIAHKILSLV